ncbi:MAG: PH domain-containing protein [Pyrinomonadaceae bacterium]
MSVDETMLSPAASGRYFEATWGAQLKAITAGVSCLLLGLCVYSLWQLLNGAIGISFVGTVMPLVLLACAALFTVRGYSVSADRLTVHRLGWSHNIELSELSSARYVPGAMTGSIRTFANGGLFAFAGNYYDSRLGAYRAYVTDGAKSVVLKFKDKTIVVSPDDPEEFIAALRPAGKSVW